MGNSRKNASNQENDDERCNKAAEKARPDPKSDEQWQKEQATEHGAPS